MLVTGHLFQLTHTGLLLFKLGDGALKTVLINCILLLLQSFKGFLECYRDISLKWHLTIDCLCYLGKGCSV